MSARINNSQYAVLKVLAGKIDAFYLGGGTALSIYYFHHRESVDLDFFTRDFNRAAILKILDLISAKLKKKVEVTKEEKRKDRVNILVASMALNKKEALKIDFIQDYLPWLQTPKLINGIKILSLADIYLRKIYAVTGTLPVESIIGEPITKGGRQEAKDFFDLYCLSSTFKGLSDFCIKYCSQLTREGIIRWFRTYSRMEIKTGLLELRLKKKVDYKDMEQHFKKEINKILEREIRAI